MDEDLLDNIVEYIRRHYTATSLMTFEDLTTALEAVSASIREKRDDIDPDYDEAMDPNK